MIVCNVCKKDLSGDEPKFTVFPAFLSAEEANNEDYHLCKHCHKEYERYKKDRDRQFFSEANIRILLEKRGANNFLT